MSNNATVLGSPAYFTGTVWRDELIVTPDGLQVSRVSFAPGARTHWHTHPKGQVLHVLSGLGWYQREGEPVMEMRAGDTVHFAAHLRHWHGATLERTVTHLAIQAEEDGVAVVWLEAVTDAQYRREADGQDRR